MRFVTFEYNDEIKTGVMSDEGKYVIGLEFEDMNKLVKAIDLSGSFSGEKIAIGDVRLKAPIIEPLQDLICIGVNYAEHAKESAMFKKEIFEERDYPAVFSKRTNYALGDGDFIDSHSNVNDSLDYECELAVIIGKDAHNVKAEEAEDYIFGYTIVNDISSRNLQTRYKQWYVGKSLDGFTAMGPWIVTKDELPLPINLDIKCYVNGELRQNSNTSSMLFDVPYVISELSKGMTLKAGTIISTGTPSGVGMGFNPPRFLKSGDVVKCEIEGIGSITNTVK